jgi:hypothetical protein
LPLHGVTLNNISAETCPVDGALYIPFRIIYSISRLLSFFLPDPQGLARVIFFKYPGNAQQRKNQEIFSLAQVFDFLDFLRENCIK